MKNRLLLLASLLALMTILSAAAGADIAAKRGDLALFLKPSWSTGSDTAGRWVGGRKTPVAGQTVGGHYVPGTSAEGHGGRQFYQYEDFAGSGILYTVKPSANGLPKGYKHKGTVVVSEIGWSQQTPLKAQDVWEIWQETPDTYKYKKGGVTQIQLLSDEIFGTCYTLDNKYGTRDLRVLVYGAQLENDAERDRELVRQQLITAINGDGLNTKR